MNIAYDYQIFSWQKYGGISRYIYELASHVSISNINHVNIVSPLFVNEYLNSNITDLNIKGYMVPKIEKTGRIISLVNNLLTKPILAKIKPDIVHETYYKRNRLAPTQSKVVLTVHDMIHERFSDEFPKNDETIQNKVAAVIRADHVICVSENTRRDLINIHGVDPLKTSVIYHGFSLTQVNGDAISELNRPYLLYVGNRGGYKNFIALLQAFASSPSLHKNYILVAFGGGKWRNSELKEIQKLGLDMSCLKNIDGDDKKLATLYKNASLFIYPSLYEGFGIPPLEAMSYGCPVVSSNSSSLPEVVGDAAVMFDPHSSEDLLFTIEQVLSSTTFRMSLIENGYKRIEKFSWAKCAEKTLCVYKDLIQ